MELRYLNRQNRFNRSLTLSNHCFPHFLKVWHYHLELELVYITESTGTRFVGDNISKFQPGDLLLLGDNLPHMWMNDDIYYQKKEELFAKAIVIHFDKDIFHKVIGLVPEMKAINQLLGAARTGLEFSKDVKQPVLKMLREMCDQAHLDQVLSLFKILDHLSTDKKRTSISSSGFTKAFNAPNSRRLDVVYDYILNHFTEQIRLEDVANLANMNSAAFCRYFKKVNKTTFSKYLNEVRIGYSCKLIIEERYSVSEIAYRSGFNNLSNFNRQFKMVKGLSPTDYLKQYPSS